VEAWARARLTPDPHGDPALGGAYRTTSLYCDTPDLDVYHRTPSYRRRKFRVRRYGDATWTYLERKSKWGDRVAKWRVSVPDTELANLAAPEVPEAWPGFWFHRRLVMRRLQPACRVAYRRLAFAGSCADGPLRLTFDRDLRGVPAQDWRLDPVENGRALLAGHVILELKFRAALPGPFKQLVAEHRLTPHAVSKYRTCCEAWGARPRVEPAPILVPAAPETVAEAAHA